MSGVDVLSTNNESYRLVTSALVFHPILSASRVTTGKRCSSLHELNRRAICEDEDVSKKAFLTHCFERNWQMALFPPSLTRFPSGRKTLAQMKELIMED